MDVPLLFSPVAVDENKAEDLVVNCFSGEARPFRLSIYTSNDEGRNDRYCISIEVS